MVCLDPSNLVKESAFFFQPLSLFTQKMLHHLTVGADKNYDTKDFVTECRSMTVTPHVARRETSIVDGRTTCHPGYQVSQRIRKRVEEIFGWDKTVAGGRKLRYKGVERNGLWWEVTAAAYDLLRMAKIAVAQAAKDEPCPVA
jgi:IS5 family transposase